jgi:hypothetical protein
MKIYFVLFCFLSFSSFASQYQLFEENGKVGIKNDQGTVVIPAAFEALGWSDKNFSVVGEVTGYRVNGRWGIINLKKEKITEPIYEELFYQKGECIVARKKINAVQTKSGCLNLRGEVKIPFVYDGIEVHGLRAIVFNLNGAHYDFGLIDLENHSLLPLSYRSINALGTLRYAVENTENKIALFSEEGKPITDFSIDSISTFYKSYAIFYQGLLQGLIDRDGAVKLEAKYGAIRIDDEGKVFAKAVDEWDFINEKNETVKQVFAEQLVPAGKNFLYTKCGRWGILDEMYKPVVNAQFDLLKPIDAEKFIAFKKHKVGVITKTGEQIIPFEYDSLYYESGNYRAFRKINGWYLLNENGKIISGKYYQSMINPSNENYAVKHLGYWGLINSKGDEFVHCVFDSVIYRTQDKILVKFKGKYGIINHNEDWIVAPQDNKLVLINDSRYWLVQPENQFLKSFSGDVIYFTPYLLRFEKEFFTEQLPDGSQRTLNYDGMHYSPVAIPERAEEVFKESEGMIGFKRDGRYGFVDKQGRLRVANRYDSIGEFHDGVAAIKLIGKWGYVNASDKIVVQPNFDSPFHFKNGLCIVSRNGNNGIINKDAKVILPLRYNLITRLPDGKFLLKQNSQLGLADDKGSVLIEPRFEELRPAQADWWIVCQQGRCGVMSSTGMDLVPLRYDQIKTSETGKYFVALKKAEWKEIILK